jgi:hypothetical protein
MSRILEKLADQHEERIINVLYKLEEDVIKEVNRATKGQLVSQRIAIQLQPKIRQAIENNFLNEADLIINDEYNKIAKEVLDEFGEMPIPNKFKSLTEANLSTINALKFQSYSGFEDIGERFIKVINDELYQSTIAGRPYEDMVSNIRGHINGVYKKSNQREINELVDYINENKFDTTKKLQVEDAVRKLHTQYASDRAGNNLRRYAGQIAHDSVMQFHGQFTIAKAKEAGLNHFTYTGTLVRDSRDFCRSMLGKTLSEKDIRDTWNSRSWQGKSNGDPFIVRGGYRCRHTWIPTDPSWLEETVDEVPEEPVIDTAPVVDSLGTIPISNLRDTIGDLSKAEITKNILQKFQKNTKDERYKELGVQVPSNVSLGSIDKESANTLLAVLNEADRIADRFDVPRITQLNGRKASGYWASMGVTRFNAGSLQISSTWINTYGKYVKKPKSLEESKKGILLNIEEMEKEKKQVVDKINALVREANDITKKYKGWNPNSLMIGGKSRLAERLGMNVEDITDEFVEQLRKDNNRYSGIVYSKELTSLQNKNKRLSTDIDNEQHKLRGTGYIETTKWKRGDIYKDMPHNGADYFDNALDRIRNTVYHEMGHHIHSMKSHTPARRVQFGENKYPLNGILQAYRPYIKNNLDLQCSRYSTTDPYEWFAENFALYLQGETKRMNEEALKLIKAIDEKKNLKDAGLIIKETEV